MGKTWRVAIVKDTATPSLGSHGLHTAFRGLPDVEVVAHVDSSTDDLARKLSYTQAQRHYLTLTAMLEREAPDIVVLCSRHPYDHLGQIEALAAAGCHVYCEKPLTASLLEADRLVEIVEGARVKLCMAHPSRYAPSYRTMKALVEAGEIGTPVTIYGRGKNDHRGGGEDLIVLGTHILDLQTFFFGAPEQVYAEVTTDGRPIVASDHAETVEPIGPAAGDQVFACFRFPGNVRGIFESRRDLYDPTGEISQMGITVLGTKGALTMRFRDAGGREARLRLSRRLSMAEDYTDYEEVPLTEDRVIPGAAPLEYELCGHPEIPVAPFFMQSNRFAVWDLMRAVEEDRQPISNVYTARLTVEMICGIYASSLSQRVVALPLTDRAHPLGEPAL